MSSSSDVSGISNQLNTAVNLPKLDEKDLFVERLRDLMSQYAESINTKEMGYHNLIESLTFKQFFITGDPQRFRNVYRKCFDLVDLNGGNIAGGATVNFSHGITNLSDSIFIYVSCVTTDPEYFTAVYPDIYLDGTNINFTNPHSSAVTSAIAVCEYTKE